MREVIVDFSGARYHDDEAMTFLRRHSGARFSRYFRGTTDMPPRRATDDDGYRIYQSDAL